MSNELLRVEGVGKDYPKLDNVGGHLRTLLHLLLGRAAPHSFSALRDISFTLRRGASLGILGENGAGKSTLLKILAGVIKPSRGEVVVRGRVGALLELGSGFHPEYTGLENIYLAAALLGLSAAEIRRKREAIIEFADIGEHIDQPIKHYSSGMVVRLGFAVATALRPDILITDEVFAVGDESFQKKCIAWMENYLNSGGTLLFCSHSMFHIQKLCQHALWLQKGEMRLYGPAFDVTHAYLAYHEEKAGRTKLLDVSAAQRDGVYAVRALRLRAASGIECAQLRHGDDLIIEGELYSPDDRAPTVSVGLVRADGTPVYGIVSDMDDYVPTRTAAHEFRFALRFPALSLLPGKYTVRTFAMDPEGMRLFDTAELPLFVEGHTRELGLCRLPHEWQAV